MEVRQKEKSMVMFGDLEVGECYRKKGEDDVYMRIVEWNPQDFNCVCLCTGRVYYHSSMLGVTRVNGAFVEE